MKKHEDVKAEIDNDIKLISLEKLLGKKIKETQGRISNEFGELTFQLYRIIFEDGTSTFVEGEHDMPYLSPLNDVKYEEMLSIYKSNPDYEPNDNDEFLTT